MILPHSDLHIYFIPTFLFALKFPKVTTVLAAADTDDANRQEGGERRLTRCCAMKLASFGGHSSDG